MPRPNATPLSEGRLAHLPLFLDVRGRPCLIIGGGAMAEGKTLFLLRSGADVTVIADRLNPALGALHAAGHITWERRPYRQGDLDGKMIVLFAREDNAGLAQLRAACQSRNILFNAVDRQEGNDFITPAVLDRSPVVVAISTGGTAPALARNIRLRLERAIPHGLGRLARIAGLMRCQVSRRLTQASTRRAFWDKVLGEEFQRRSEHLDAQALTELLGETLRAAETPVPETETGQVSLVGAGPGKADYLTLGGLRALEQADLILYDVQVGSEVLNHARRDAQLICVGTYGNGPTTNQDFINRQMVSHAKRGLQVVRLKGGDPMVFGRAGEEYAYLRHHHIPVQIIPGVSIDAPHITTENLASSPAWH